MNSYEQRWGRRVYWLLVILLLVLFWKNTNSWPVAAVVDYQPIWSWELNQSMYDQVGGQSLDNLVTETLIRNELARRNIQVGQEEIDLQVADIKTQVGSDESFAQALAFQGMTEETLREQIRLQKGLEQLAEPSTDSAQMSENIYDLVQRLRSEGRVWTMPRTAN